MTKRDLIKKAKSNFEGNVVRNRRAIIALTIGIIIISLILNLNSAIKKSFEKARGEESSKYIRVYGKYGDGVYNFLPSIKGNSWSDLTDTDIELLEQKYNKKGFKVQVICNKEQNGSLDVDGGYSPGNLVITNFNSFYQEEFEFLEGEIPKDKDGIIITQYVKDNFINFGSDGLPKGGKFSLDIFNKVANFKLGRSDNTQNEVIKVRVDGIIKNGSTPFNSDLKDLEGDRVIGENVIYISKEKLNEFKMYEPNLSFGNFYVNILVENNKDGDAVLRELKNDGYAISGVLAYISDINYIKDFMSIILISLGAIIIITSVVCIINTLYLSMTERIKDIAIMKAMGIRFGDIGGMYIIESGLIGIYAGVYGVIISSLITLSIKILLLFIDKELYSIGIGNVDIFMSIGLVLLSVLISVISSIPIVVKALKIRVIDGLKV